MRILITNDDGITAPGLKAAEDIAHELAGPDGEVWVVAPESEQSGVAHCISYTKPMRLNQLGPRRFAVDGSPADCVICALKHLMIDAAPDLILSGVNRGHNVAEDVVYSGTVGGAMEGALHRVPAIALSQYYGPQNVGLDATFEAARRHGVSHRLGARVRVSRQVQQPGVGGVGLQPRQSLPGGRVGPADKPAQGAHPLGQVQCDNRLAFKNEKSAGHGREAPLREAVLLARRTNSRDNPCYANV
jgi:hypothetical protein